MKWMVTLWLSGALAWSQGSLKTVNFPKPDLTAYMQDEKVLVVLGKALFWDMQVGSDGRVACASCHFHAGADHRSGGVFFAATQSRTRRNRPPWLDGPGA